MSFSSGSGARVRSSSAPRPPRRLYQFFKECLNFPALFFLNLERLFTPRIRKECNNIISEKSLPALPSILLPPGSLAMLALAHVFSSPAVPWPGTAMAFGFNLLVFPAGGGLLRNLSSGAKSCQWVSSFCPRLGRWLNWEKQLEIGNFGVRETVELGARWDELYWKLHLPFGEVPPLPMG